MLDVRYGFSDSHLTSHISHPIMRLSLQEVDHIALLSRLELSGAERERAAGELSQILEHFDVLRQLDTDNVPPTDHVLPLQNVLRDDVPRPSLSPQDALQNAPEQADNQFQVPRVVEAE